MNMKKKENEGESMSVTNHQLTSNDMNKVVSKQRISQEINKSVYKHIIFKYLNN